MPLLIGVDIGTTTIPSLAVNGDNGSIVHSATTVNDARYAGRPQGRSEWNVDRIVGQTILCLKDVGTALGARSSEVVGIGVTGQQHGMVLVDSNLNAVSPYINWQDQRGNEPHPDGGSYIEVLSKRLGADQYQRHGCYLRTGFMNVTLKWLTDHDLVPAGSKASFIMDLVASKLCKAPLTSDPTVAGSAGLLDIHKNEWNADALKNLGLSIDLLPQVGSVREQIGTLTTTMAGVTGLPIGIPVFTPIGDNQASFLGSVSERHSQLSINVGTGGQVSAYSETIGQHPALEVRPFPYGGFLLANVGACGGHSFAVLENFFRAVATDVFDIEVTDAAYERMKELASRATNGTEGLNCLPLFTGTRQDPTRRACWSGLSPGNFSPAMMTRSLLEGMATVFNDGFAALQSCGVVGITEIVGAGNGMRENQVLIDCIEQQFGMSVRKPVQKEEATLGAAITAAIGCGVLSGLSESSRWLNYE